MEEKIIDLLWLIEAGEEEINVYLGERPYNLFVSDVLALKKKLSDKKEVQRIIDELTKLL